MKRTELETRLVFPDALGGVIHVSVFLSGDAVLLAIGRVNQEVEKEVIQCFLKYPP